MQSVELVNEDCYTLTDEVLDTHYASSYGIFNGTASETAVLRFSAHAAEWVADEVWHPQQSGHWLADGRYELTIPYHESPELVGEIMRWMPDVQVVAPMKLKNLIITTLEKSLAAHQ